MTDDLAVLIFFAFGFSFILGALAFLADWLTAHPHSWITRKFDRILRSFGI